MTASGSDPLHSSNQNQLGRTFSHEPVMLKEVLDTFASLREGLFVDATVGGGGHAEAAGAASEGVVGCARRLVREGGVGRLYRGYGYTLVRAGPVAGILLPCFEVVLPWLEQRL